MCCQVLCQMLCGVICNPHHSPMDINEAVVKQCACRVCPQKGNVKSREGWWWSQETSFHLELGGGSRATEGMIGQWVGKHTAFVVWVELICSVQTKGREF